MPSTPTPTATQGIVILTVQKSADKIQATTGDIIRYVLLVRNLGTDTATAAWIRDPIPNFTQYHDSSGVFTSDAVTWEGNILPGSTLELWLEVEMVTASSGTIVSNTATAASAESNTVTSNTALILWVAPPPSTATPELIGKHEAVVYPNPVSGGNAIFMYYCDSSGEVGIRIYNSGGRLAGECRQNAQGGVLNRLAWNVSELPPGVYVFEVRKGKQLLARNKFSRIP
jgi:uncharacterized repeat protein (TIGR01451 family)